MPNQDQIDSMRQEDRNMLLYSLVAIIVVGLLFYFMLGVQVETVSATTSAADFSAETQVSWVCPLTPFH